MSNLYSYILPPFLFLLYYLYSLTQPPRRLAPGLPVIPIWVAFLPLICTMRGRPVLGQDELYERYIRKKMDTCGAVVIYFGSRWSVLVGCPQGIRQLFASERDIFQKAGNHIKLPNAAISQLTGGNIISETGEKWRRYASVIRPAIKDKMDPTGTCISTERFIDYTMRASARHSTIELTPLAQRFAMENITLSLFRKDLGFLAEPPPAIHSVHSLVKKHIFHPFFLSFPAFDAYPWLFPSRVVARHTINELEKELLSAFAYEEDQGNDGKYDPADGSVLDAVNGAFLSGQWSEREYIDNLKILFIAGHENIQQAVVSSLWLLATRPSDQATVRLESREYSPSDDRTDYLYSFIHEVLRLYPPIPQLINRRLAVDTTLTLASADGDQVLVPLQKGTYLGWTAFATHRSKKCQMWADPDTFRPSRWGSSVREVDAMARRANNLGEFISFHGGARACPGRSFALRSLHVVLLRLVRGFVIRLAGDEPVRLSPGGLLAPRNVRLVFEPLEPRGEDGVEG